LYDAWTGLSASAFRSDRGTDFVDKIAESALRGTGDRVRAIFERRQLDAPVEPHAPASP
jgi:hypothetical protein